MVSELRSYGIECHIVLYLDVYTESYGARALCDKYGFSPLASAPLSDPAEGGKAYIIMVKGIGVAVR